MKVISILQPWASLIVLGHKKIETRSWNTKYRGPLLIHASAGKNPSARQLAECDFSNFLPKGVHHEKRGKWRVMGHTNYHNLPFGKIIGSVNLVDTIETDRLVINVKVIKKHVSWMFDNQEFEMGDYDDGRFGWLLSDIVKFDEAIPAKGKLGIWNWDPPMHHAIHHLSLNGEPSLQVINAINAMAELAYNELEKLPPIK